MTGNDWTTGSRDWCQTKFLTSRHIRMHRVIFYISNRALCLGMCVGLGLEKEKYLKSKTKSNVFQWL